MNGANVTLSCTLGVYAYLKGRTERECFCKVAGIEMERYHMNRMQTAIERISRWWYARMIRIKFIECRIHPITDSKENHVGQPGDPVESTEPSTAARAVHHMNSHDRPTVGSRALTVNDVPRWFIVRELRNFLSKPLLLALPELVRIAHIIDTDIPEPEPDEPEASGYRHDTSSLRRMELFMNSFPPIQERRLSNVLSRVARELSSMCSRHVLARGGMIAARLNRLQHQPENEIVEAMLDHT